MSSGQASDHRPAGTIQADRTKSEVAILTGGGDRPYALGLAAALIDKEVPFDFIASDELRSDELEAAPMAKFINLRGDVRSEASLPVKIARIVSYYVRLIRYAARAEPKVFHVLWNNRFETFDRTLLPFYYKLLGKRLVHTVHNVNARQRDGTDSWLNRLTLRIQYRQYDHLMVHTQLMQDELVQRYGVRRNRVSVIPFGINDTIPRTNLTELQARSRLGLTNADKVILFFGNIAAYKGLEALVQAFTYVAREFPEARLVIAGRIKGAEEYWREVQSKIDESGHADRIRQDIRFVPDEEIEVFFKAADVLVLPYTSVYQSGVLFLSYSFGLPVIATDVGSLREEIVQGKTGLVCPPGDLRELAAHICKYFVSDLYRDLRNERPAIRRFALQNYSWDEVASRCVEVYSRQAHVVM